MLIKRKKKFKSDYVQISFFKIDKKNEREILIDKKNEREILINKKQLEDFLGHRTSWKITKQPMTIASKIREKNRRYLRRDSNTRKFFSSRRLLS